MRARSTFLAVLLTIIALVSLSTAQSGPFGFERGMTKAQVERLIGPANHTPDNPDIAWTFSTAPKPNPHFEKYVLFFSPTQGLLKIVAVGKDIQTGDAGVELHAEFDDILSGISQKYGKPEHVFDFCSEDTIGCSGSSVWMLGLIEKNRTLSAFWDGAPASNVVAISLEAKALKLNKGWCRLAYEYEGWGAFLDMRKANENTSY